MVFSRYAAQDHRGIRVSLLLATFLPLQGCRATHGAVAEDKQRKVARLSVREPTSN